MTKLLEEDRVLQLIELATKEVSDAGDEIKSDSMEIKEIRRNGNNYAPIKGPGFFSILGLAVRGLFTL